MKPLDEIQDQAALLARWLEEHPGATAPDGLDPDVLEAVYALRPDLAPAPSLSLDDILAGVTTGPFATAAPVETAAAEPPPAPSLPPLAPPPATAQVVDLAAVRGRTRGWFWPTAGALAAAAMALIVVLPQLRDGVPDLAGDAATPRPAAPPEAFQIAEVASEPGTAASAPAPAPGLVAVPEAAMQDAGGVVLPLEEQPKLAMDQISRGAAGGGEPAPDRIAREKDTTSQAAFDATVAASRAQGPVARPAAAAPAPAEPAGSWSLVPPRGQTESAAPGHDGDDFVGQDAPAEEPADEGAAKAATSASASVAPQAEAPLSRDLATFDDADLGDEEEARAAASPARDARVGGRPSSRDESARSSGRATARKRADERALEAAPAAPPADVVAGSIAEVPADLDALRAAANPLDYRSDWYLTDPALDPATRAQVAAACAQVQAAVVAGDLASATGVLEPLLGSRYAAVAQDVAFRLATLWMQAGQGDRASAVVRRGLTAGATPTVFRSRLLALQGALLEEAGREAEAAESYRQAVRANASRP